MTTTILKNTGIKDLMEVSAGNLQVLERMAEEFRQKVQEPFKRTERFNRGLQFAFKPTSGTCAVSVSVDAYRRGYRIIVTIE
jgi:hypothetical protein